MSWPIENYDEIQDNEHLFSVAEGGVSPSTTLTPPAVRPPLHPLALNTQYGGKKLPRPPVPFIIRPTCISPTLRHSRPSQNCFLLPTSNNKEEPSNKQSNIVKKTDSSENTELLPLNRKREGSPLEKRVVTFDNKNYLI